VLSRRPVELFGARSKLSFHEPSGFDGRVLSIVYFASDPIAIPVLQWLGNRPDIGRLMVVTSTDARSGRGRKLRPNAVKTAAMDLGLEVQQPVKPDSQLTADLRREGFRTGFVFAYGHILKPELLDCFEGYLLNFHGSILPRYRGASPVETAIAEGDDETGVSLMQVIRRMDAGPIAAVERVPIRPTTTGPELRRELSRAAVRCLDRQWNGIRDRPGRCKQQRRRVKPAGHHAGWRRGLLLRVRRLVHKRTLPIRPR